jgi:DMSO/TMAO reductase YedYZ molybdopterin-dependent catalytic subunit
MTDPTIANHASAPAGLIIRQKEPTNLEMPFQQLESFLTPSELFYIRSHFATPVIDASDYRLTIDGAVRRPLSLRYEELREMRSETRVATLECAGNGRVFLVPQVRGAQWELGAVGNAEWTGVPLRDLLELAGLEDDACDIVLEGADIGMPAEEPKPPNAISYARSIPRDKAIRPEVLIAYQMNGRDLSLDHGFPIRAIVPGHYGMASVKWLTRLQVVRQPFQGYWQTSDYAFWESLGNNPIRRPLAEMSLKSAISRPQVYETIPPNQHYTIFGAAWAGETEVAEVSISTDGGQSWAQARFVDRAQRYAWRRWTFDWMTPDSPGRYILLARAKDSNGAVQPDEHDWNYGTYVIAHLLPIEVDVGDSSRLQTEKPAPAERKTLPSLNRKH